MKKFDYLIIAFLLVISFIPEVVFLATRGRSLENYVVITVDGEKKKEIFFNTYIEESFEVKTKYGTNVVEIKNGKVQIIEADCPDKICVKSKPIDHQGQMLVCLPHKVIVQILGIENQQLDAESYWGENYEEN